MRMNKGVEWAVHACSVLAPLAPGHGLSLAALAQFHGVPLAYMAKQMQLLSRAGIVATSRGKTGGYRLARLPREISLWDITRAVDGTEPMFRCTEIRQQGPCASSRAECAMACPIARAFAGAEQAFRDALKGVTLEAIVLSTGEQVSSGHLAEIFDWLNHNVTALPQEAR